MSLLKFSCHHTFPPIPYFRYEVKASDRDWGQILNSEMNYPAAELRSIIAMRSPRIISAVFGIFVYTFFRGL